MKKKILAVILGAVMDNGRLQDVASERKESSDEDSREAKKAIQSVFHSLQSMVLLIIAVRDF